MSPDKSDIAVCLEDSSEVLRAVITFGQSRRGKLSPPEEVALRLIRSNAITTLQHIEALLGLPDYHKKQAQQK